MATFCRTEKGFAAALDSAKWFARFHNKDCALFVPKANSSYYVTSIPSLVRPDDVEPGTQAMLVHPDGSETKMF